MYNCTIKRMKVKWSCGARKIDTKQSFIRWKLRECEKWGENRRRIRWTMKVMINLIAKQSVHWPMWLEIAEPNSVGSNFFRKKIRQPDTNGRPNQFTALDSDFAAINKIHNNGFFSINQCSISHLPPKHQAGAQAISALHTHIHTAPFEWPNAQN